MNFCDVILVRCLEYICYVGDVMRHCKFRTPSIENRFWIYKGVFYYYIFLNVLKSGMN